MSLHPKHMGSLNGECQESSPRLISRQIQIQKNTELLWSVADDQCPYRFENKTRIPSPITTLADKVIPVLAFVNKLANQIYAVSTGVTGSVLLGSVGGVERDI